MQEDCLFCKIIRGEIKNKSVYEDEHVYAFQDINPQAPFHILIIPKKHIGGLSKIEAIDRVLVGDICLAAQKITQEHSLDKKGYRLVVNSGPDGGETVGHLHFHLLGGRKFNWPPG